MKNNKRNAFTLIEMLVVVVIIGIILAIVFSSATSFLNNRSKKLYNVHMDVVEEVMKNYIDQYKGQLSNSDSSCFNIDYNTLISDGLIEESDISCKGNIIVSKVENSFKRDYYLSCVDGNNESVKKSDTLPSGCKGFNGKFKMEYTIYEDNNKEKVYDGSNYIKNAYVYFTSTSPYQTPISHFEYTTNLDGNWTKIASGSNLGTIDDIKNFDGNLYVRSVDKDKNVSSSVGIPIKMDNNGPSFSTNVSGTYLTKTITVSDISDKGVGTLAEKAYSFDGGITWQKNNTKDVEVNETFSVCVKDALGNISCKDVKVTGIDRVVPIIVASSEKVYVTKNESKNIADFFKVTYGTFGGSVKCDVENTSSLEFGLNTVSCTATGTNTLTSTASIVISHKYNATPYCNGGRTLSNGNCTYYYSSNQSQCGCDRWNQKCSAYNQKCSAYNQKCSEYNKKCVAYNRVCSSSHGENCNAKTIGACDATARASLSKQGYHCGSASDCSMQVMCYQTCTVCDSYTNGTCKTWDDDTTSCKTWVDDTTSCKTWVDDTTSCKTWTNTTCATASSCTKTENQYRYYECGTTIGINGDTGETINPIVSGSLCVF